jgi:sec-independent protein translocase protein TatB
MFDIGFSEVLLIFVIALVVLGPEKLPRVASQVGRWIGRARSMARQFREQLEEEVNLEQVRKAHEKTKSQGDGGAGTSTTGASGGTGSDAGTGAASTVPATSDTSAGSPHDAQQASTEHGTQTLPDTSSASAATYRGPDPADFRADTFSHAHPTNEYGANPYTASGAAEDSPSAAAHTTSAELPPSAANATPGSPVPSVANEGGSGQTLSEANVAAAQPQSESDAEGHAASGEAYAHRKDRDNTPGTDNHGN